MKAEIITLAELPNFAAKVATKIQPGDVVALSGPLAAGKTTFTKALLQALGYTGRVSSPTFVLEKHYHLDHPTIQSVVHLDFYRLTPQQTQSFGWQDHLGHPGTITIIEWPERAAGTLPHQIKTVTIELADEKDHQTRRFTFSDNFSD